MTECLSVEPILGMFKRGDDFRNCLDKTNSNVVEALKMYATDLQEDAQTLLQIAQHLTEVNGIKAEADTHFISITCPKEIANIMIEKDLVMYEKYDYENEEEIEDVEDIVEECVEEILEDVVEDIMESTFIEDDCNEEY